MIASVGVDRDGQSYNVNADTAGEGGSGAGRTQGDLLTDVAGWLADPQDEGSLNSRVTVGEVEGGPRVDHRRHAAEARRLRRGGPRRRRLGAHHRRPPAHSLLLELFTNAGIGTMMTGE